MEYPSSKMLRKPTEPAELLQGTLDLLVLKAVSLGKLHGYGILLRIGQISGGSLSIEQGALYPALYRLERQDLLATEWGLSDNNRRAKYYSLTAAGRKRLEQEQESWSRLVSAIGMALKASSSEV
jgi:PadR family transcriptional regulator, regulatory protein PadR